MSRDYIILRHEDTPAAVTSPHSMPSMAPRGTRGTPKRKTVVEVATLAPRKAAAVAREKGVLGVAPAMPMRLITPLKLSSAANGAGSGIVDGMAWGIGAVGADRSPFTGEGVTVAVLDTGIDPTHAAFKGVTLERKNFTAEADGDLHGHGTHCAGTIFGRDVDGTRIGVARGVERALIGKVLSNDGARSDQIVQAIHWALDNGAHVVSMSLGIDFPGFVAELQEGGVPPELATSMALDGYRANLLLFQAMAALVSNLATFQQPCLLVAAAGNESRRDEDGRFEIGVSPPAVATGFVSVAAVATTDGGFEVAPFSNTGARVSGPGVNITSAKVGGGLVSMNGTSMATPHVAGVAALWAEKLIKSATLSGTALLDRLVGSASHTGMKSGFDPGDVGDGIVQAPLG